MKRKRTIEELVAEFSNAQIEQDKQIELGNARAGNTAIKRGIRAFKELCSLYGDSGREALTSLFGHSNDSVRSLAAAYLLRYCTDRSLAVLRDVARSGKGFAKMEAFYCMKNWEEGTWELDPAPETINGGRDSPEQQP